MKHYLFFLLISIGGIAQAQPTVGGIAGKGLDMNPTIGGWISEIDYTDYEPTGNVYLFEDWKKADIVFKSGPIAKDMVVKVNLLHHTIEIKDQRKVRTFSIEKLKYFEVNILADDSVVRFCNPYEFNYADGTPVTGVIIQTYDSGSWEAGKRYYLQVIESNYIPALDAGSRQDQYHVKSEYYLIYNNTLYPVYSNKRKFIAGLSLAKEERRRVLSYLKEKGYNPRNESDIKFIIRYLNRHNLWPIRA